MDERVRELTSNSGVLRSITGSRSGGGYAVVDLIFDRGRLRLTCDADTDEIVVQVDDAQESELEAITDDDALSALIGKVIEHAWEMSNDLGFADGFQIRCLDLESRRESCCQFEVAAAAIATARVGPVG